MRRTTKIALSVVGSLIGIPVLAVAILIAAANTDAGRREIEALVPRLTGGKVVIAQLSGEFPRRLQVGHAEVRDSEGAWVVLDQVALDWSPVDLFAGQANASLLSAHHVAVSRLPASSSSSTSKGGARLPVRISVDDFHIDRLDLAPPIVAAPASVSLAGRLRLDSLEEADGTLTIQRLDAPGKYSLNGKVDSESIQAHVSGSEPAHGLLSALADLPELGPLSLSADINGPRAAERTNLALSAGPLHVEGRGTVDFVAEKADLDLKGEAPAMSPGPQLSWQSARLDAHLHGAFAKPDAEATLDIEALTAGNAGFDRIDAKVTGQGGKLSTSATIAGFRIAGQPSPFTTVPLKLDADAILDEPSRPITFRLSHPLITMDGHATLGGDINGAIRLTLPDLAPFATSQGINLQGRASASATATRKGDTTRITADGQIAVTSGEPIAVKAGGDVKFGLAVALSGQDLAIEHATIDSQTLHAAVQGSRKDGAVDADLTLAISDLSAIQPPLSGALKAHASIKGPETGFAANATIEGDLAAPGIPRGPLMLSVTAQGLPNKPSGKIDAQGRLAGAPLALSAQLDQGSDGTVRLAINQASWKSLQAKGELSLAAGSSWPSGQLNLDMARLADLGAFVGAPLQGEIHASLNTATTKDGKPQGLLKVDAGQLELNGNRVERVGLDARIDDPATHPVLAAKVTIDGIAASGLTGNAKIDATGPEDALSVRLSSDLQSTGQPAQIVAAATADLRQHVVRVALFEARYADESARLLQPLRVSYGTELAFDRLRLGVGKATIVGAGKLSPSLDVTLSVRDASPALAAPFLPPELAADGVIALDAKLQGNPGAPKGNLRLSAHHVQLRSDEGRAMPPADLDASANLMGSNARVTARLAAGNKASLKLDGTAPLGSAGPIDMRASGFVDLALLDPLLTPEGRSVQGKLTLDAGIAGISSAPRISGTAALAGGSVEDFAQAVHLTDIRGKVDADNDTLRIDITGRAGPGSWALSGTATPTAPGIPVDLRLTAKDARPLASDFITADLNADLTLRGQATEQLALGGAVKVGHAEINIPDSLPKSVATLNVVKAGEKPPPVPSPLAVDLDLTVRAPEQVFVRGHGLDAEMGGKLTIGGTIAQPQIAGGFDLRRGTFSLAGQTLNFTSGRVGFDGTSPSGKLDPTLNFVATSTAGDITATLNVTGYADAPKIGLSSAPSLPQDEILAQLLFGQSTKQLSPFQMAEILDAVASLSGVTPGGISNPLAAVRKGLGLDRLSVGSATNNTNGASIEAGKYVANGIYVGTKQNTSGGTQATVQIDLTKHLKATTQLGTGGGTPATGATPDNDPGSSVGLTYQFEY